MKWEYKLIELPQDETKGLGSGRSKEAELNEKVETLNRLGREGGKQLISCGN